MSENPSMFVQALLNDGKTIGFIPGGALGAVLQAWGSACGSDGVVRVRLPYQPGRKDRQLASVLLATLGQPALKRSISTARAWDEIAGLCRECGCRLVVIENADLLDKYGLAYIDRGDLPAVILVGGERLARQIDRNTAYARHVLSWRSESPARTKALGD
jgi:hypothetical protein